VNFTEVSGEDLPKKGRGNLHRKLPRKKKNYGRRKIKE